MRSTVRRKRIVETVASEASDKALTGLGKQERSLAMCEAVIDLASAVYNVSGTDLRRSERSALGISRVRQIAMYVAHSTLSIRMADVGLAFSRDRTTVLYACQIIEELREDSEFDAVVSMFERVVRAAFQEE